MLRFYASNFARLGSTTSTLRFFTPVGATPDQVVAGENLAYLLEQLDDIDELCTQIGMRVAAKVITRTRAEYKEAAPNYGKVKSDFTHLEKTISAELEGRWLLYLPEDAARYYLHGPTPFGELVANNFPSAAYDIREACKCVALSRNTAAVFHAMRVLERGLHVLAGARGVSMEYENWRNVLDQIESKIREAEKLPKGKDKSDFLEFHSKAATQFRYFKDAWRNHVSHSQGHQYDSEEALSVVRHVEQFMRHLATQLAEKD